MTITLKEGAYYRRRDGKIVGPIIVRDPQYYFRYQFGRNYWAKDGSFHYDRRQSRADLIARVPSARTPKRPRKVAARREVLSKRMINTIVATLFTNGNKESAENLCLYNERGQYLGGYSEDGMRSTLGKISLSSPAQARKH